MPQNNDPLQGLTIDQIDITDPESRAFVSKHVDFNDKETSSYFQDNEVKGSRSLLGRAKDEFIGATATGFPGLVARKAYDWFDIGMDELRKKAPGQTDEWYEDTHTKAVAQAQRDVIAEAEEKARLDPTWRPEDSWLDNALSGRWAATIGGMGAGSAGPEMLVAPGSSALTRIAAQGGINAGADLGYQGLEYTDDVRDDISLAQAGASGLFGAGMQGGGEVLGKLLGKVATPDARLSADDEAAREALFATGSFEDIMANAPDAKTLDPATVAEFVRARDAGEAVSARTTYAEPTGPMPTVQQEMDLQGGEYQPSLDMSPEAAPTAPARRRGEGGRFAREPQQLEMDLPEGQAVARQEEFDFETPKAAPAETAVAETGEVPKNVDDIVSHVNETSASWENAPEVEVYEHFNDADGIDPNALGVYDPESGRVMLNSKAIEAEAKQRGLTNQEMTNTVLFHEGLGHYGLAQKFRDDLDGTLDGWYEKSPWFQKKVDEWIEKNPSSYVDEENLTARAGEEILAEMSENGAIPKKMLNDIKNKIKEVARDFGFEWNVSEREIRTILAQAHDAVINGKKGDIVGNGFRTMTPYGSSPAAVARREKILAASARLDETKKGETKTTQPFPEEEPDYYRFKHVTQEGEPVLGTYRIDEEGNIDSFSIGARGQANKLGPSAIRKIARDLRKEHPEAKTIEGFRISGARKAAGAGPSDVSANALRFMKRTADDANPQKAIDQAVKEVADMFQVKNIDKALRENDFRVQVKYQLELNGNSPDLLERQKPRYMRSSGSGSEGPLQGRTTTDAKKGEGKSSPLGRIRTKELAEDILDDIDVTKTKESFSQWIDDAGRIKMTEKAASNLATGTTSPEMLAAREYATKSVNRVKQLQRKIDTGKATVRDMQLFAREVKRLDNVSQSITDVMANAARLLNTGKITVETDKALIDGIRNMLATADLETPEGIAAAVKKLTKDEKKQKRMETLLRSYSEVLNLPRSLMSSMDLSAPFRQGIFLIGNKNFWKDLPSMFKMFGSQKAFDNLMKGIENGPNYSLMEKSKLALQDVGSNLTTREEQFLSTWAEKLPVAGAFVKASNRGYTGFLNKLRADVFNDIVAKSKAAGVDFNKDPKALNDIAYFINGATGRGKLPGKWETAAPALAGALFSPRLMASRVQMLNPVTYARYSPVVRKEAIKSLLSFGAISSTVISLSAMGGASVELDPRSSNFAKVRVGDTRYDLLGGFSQYLTLAARLASNSTKNAKGEIKTLGEGYKPDTGLTVLAKFFRSKASPVASYFADMLDGKNVIGEEFKAGSDAVKRFIPMFLSDLGDMVDQYGPVKGPLMASPGFFGISTQTYPDPEGRDRLGRKFDGKVKETPVDKEIEKISAATGSELFKEVSKSVTVDGEKISLTEEQANEYAETAGRWIEEDIKEEMSTPEWSTYSDKEKADIIKDIAKDARKDARAELFGE